MKSTGRYIVIFFEVTPEKTLAYFCTFVKKMQTWACPAYYLRRCSIDLGHIFSFDKHVGKDD